MRNPPFSRSGSSTGFGGWSSSREAADDEKSEDSPDDGGHQNWQPPDALLAPHPDHHDHGRGHEACDGQGQAEHTCRPVLPEPSERHRDDCD